MMYSSLSYIYDSNHSAEMNVSMQLCILMILIAFSGCSVFIGYPKSSWTTSSHVCSLPRIHEINTTDIFISLNPTDYKEVKKAWTGTVIKHTRWAAFIGCGRSLASMDSGIRVKTAEDCLKHCSDVSSATYFVIKSSTCYCLTTKPEINGDINDCRGNCTNAIYTPCSSGRSAMVFTFIEDLNIQPANKYIEKECLTTTKYNSKFTISDCNAQNLYGCTNMSIELNTKSWYEYQESCLKAGSSVLYDRNTVGSKAAYRPLWTPIFRSHILITGKLTGKESCVAINKTEIFTVENCTSQFPFLCLGKQKKNTIDYSRPNCNRYPRFITLPLGLVVAVILFVLILIFVMVLISSKAFRRIRLYQEQLNRVNERLPGTEFSNYTGIEETNEDVNDSGYKELSDNITQQRAKRDEKEMNQSEDKMDYQGYLVPEQHYHTIPEVEVHYAEADVNVRTAHHGRLDSDDYLEPVI